GRDERRACAVGHDGALGVWDVVTGQPLQTFQLSTGPLNSLALDPPGYAALTGGATREPAFWDVRTGAAIRLFKGHRDLAPWTALSADGRHALSGGVDGPVKIWDVDGGECLGSLDTGGRHITAVALSGNRRYALAGDERGRLRIWFLDWNLEANEASEWDESARPFLGAFLRLHAPYASPLPKYWTTGAAMTRALSRSGPPVWNDE